MTSMVKNSPFVSTASVRHALLLAATSASVLAYEILLMRLLSIAQWHYLAYMVISMAMLGLGASGSLLFLFLRNIRPRVEGWLVGLSGGTAVSFSLCFGLSQRVGLDPLQLIWQPHQWVLMVLTYLVMAIPFLLAGGIAGIILSCAGERVHRIYAVDLMGAGVGSAAIVPALYLGPPWTLLPILGALVLLGAVPCCVRMGHNLRGSLWLVLSAGGLVWSTLTYPPLPRIHETKGLPMTLAFPDSRIEAQRNGPLGTIHVVGSSLIRHVPGLSLDFGIHGDTGHQDIPRQKALFVDADGLSPITCFRGDADELEYLDFTTVALPYFVRSPQKALAIGAGGGSDVLLGVRHGVRDIKALEINGQIGELLLGPFAQFSGHLYRRPGITLEIKEARQFLHATRERFDLIQLSLLESFGNSTGGLQSGEESYLYTIEAFDLYLSRLTRTGLLSITRWLSLPPRDSLKIVATALSALKRMGLSDQAGRHILFIRSWKTATILVSRSPFTQDEIRGAEGFCHDRSFDMGYYAGMGREKANIFDVQPSPYDYLGTMALAGPESNSFLRDYIFDITPTTDDRPYFSHFFRWRKAPVLFHHLRREWLPLVELGYIFIMATLAQAVIAGGVFILAPLFFMKRPRMGTDGTLSIPTGRDIIWTVLYFGSIGLGFMFLEMALIPKYVLLLASPVYAVAVVLGTMLVFAGIGSMCAGGMKRKGPYFPWLGFAVIPLWVGIHMLMESRWMDNALGWPLGLRLALAVVLISTLAFFLGGPFPWGLGRLSKRFPALVPWAWGINGCASVVGAVLGKCLAVSMGFRFVMVSACIFYMLAMAISTVGFKNLPSERGVTPQSTIGPRRK